MKMLKNVIRTSWLSVRPQTRGLVTKADRDQYEERGFLVVKGLVPEAQLNKYKQRFKDIANGIVKLPGLVVQKDVTFKDKERNENTVYKLQELYMDQEVLFQYCKDPTILDYTEEFLGTKDLMAVHTMLINKPPDAGTKSSRHPLHQDLHYFPFRPADKIIATWTAMERVNRANGCLVALPGSHREPLLKHEYPEWTGGVNKMYHGIPREQVKGWEDKRVYLEMEPGDCVFFHPLLIHGSGTNRTKGYRKAISCHFAASDCHYIDVAGTSQENIAKEVLEVAKKQIGVELDDYRQVWQFRAQVVRGERKTL